MNTTRLCIVTVIISDGVDSSRSVLSAATSLVGCGEVEVGRDVEEQTHSHTNTGGTARPLKDIKTFQNEPFLQSDELKYGTRPISMPQKPSFPVFFFSSFRQSFEALVHFPPPPTSLFCNYLSHLSILVLQALFFTSYMRPLPLLLSSSLAQPRGLCPLCARDSAFALFFSPPSRLFLSRSFLRTAAKHDDASPQVRPEKEVTH